ncbi:MAG: DUF6350 family protein [Actinomycetes bacterium]
MSLLTRPAQDTGDHGGRTALTSPFALGALAAVQSVVGSLLCVVGPVVAVWIASTRTGASWSEAVRIAADAWLLAHGAGVAVTGGHVALLPLGLTLVPAAWCWTAGRRMAVALGLGSGVAAPGRSGRHALAAFVGVYALLAAVVSLLAASPVARPVSAQALLGGAALALLASGTALLTGSRSARRPAPWRLVADRLRLPAPLRRLLPAAGIALGVWLASAAVVLAAAVLVRFTDVLAAHRALDPGPVGGLGLALVQVALVPTLVVWAGAWLAGPGFAVGADTTVTPWTAEIGAVPALPVLGALPAHPTPSWLAAALLLPVAAGALAGRWLSRRPAAERPRWQGILLDAAGCGALAGLGAGALAWLTAGSGPGRLATLGPTGWLVAVTVAAEVAAGCALALLPGARSAQRSNPLNWLRSRSQRS